MSLYLGDNLIAGSVNCPYNVGQVYESLSTTDPTSIYTGTTWEAIADRKEWNEKETEYPASVGSAKFRLSSDGRVDVVFDNWQQTGNITIDEAYKTKDYRTLIPTQNPGSSSLYYCIISYDKSCTNQGNRAYGSGSYQTGKDPDRTFKRWKRLS